MNTINVNNGRLLYQEQTMIQGRRVYGGNEEGNKAIVNNIISNEEKGQEDRTIFEEVRIYQNKLLYLEFEKSGDIKDFIKKTRDEFLGVAENAQDKEKRAKIDALVEKMDDYWKPEAVAERIFDFAIGFFEGFTERYGKGSEQLDEFYELIKGAVEEGYKQAKDMLGLLSEEVSGVLEDTMNKFSEKFDHWYKNMKEEVSQTRHLDIAA